MGAVKELAIAAEQRMDDATEVARLGGDEGIAYRLGMLRALDILSDHQTRCGLDESGNAAYAALQRVWAELFDEASYLRQVAYESRE